MFGVLLSVRVKCQSAMCSQDMLGLQLRIFLYLSATLLAWRSECSIAAFSNDAVLHAVAMVSCAMSQGYICIFVILDMFGRQAQRIYLPVF